MIKKIVTPQNKYLYLHVPNQCIGKEIEVLLYAKEELLEESTIENNNAARFKGLLTNEEADKYQSYLKQARNEWGKSKLSDKYRGIISKKEGQKLNKHIKQMRSE